MRLVKDKVSIELSVPTHRIEALHDSIGYRTPHGSETRIPDALFERCKHT